MSSRYDIVVIGAGHNGLTGSWFSSAAMWSAG
jgi:tRNA U34 5-carboxymethylaminomethyl modifying enzyme MnmG/GidA